VGRSSKTKPSRARAAQALTARELDVLAQVANGEPTSAISQRLGISENTIKSHLTSVYRKTGSRNRVQATRHYLDRYGEPPAT
jgi:DNA-binding CsgD family transcriptional regulator